MGFMQIKDLKVHYPIRSGFWNRVTDHVNAVDGVSMEIEEGKTYGLVGESGSGKSTDSQHTHRAANDFPRLNLKFEPEKACIRYHLRTT